MKPEKISFACSPQERMLVTEIRHRARKLRPHLDGLHLVKLAEAELCARMDLIAVHANGCRLDFKKLLSFDDYSFLHDLDGIEKHLDRTTGHLQNCFVPRCAK
jgi:hypothetical protein